MVDIDIALVRAAKDGNLLAVQVFVYLDANIRAFKDQALRYAAENGHIEVVKYLVSKGSYVSADNYYALKNLQKTGFWK